MQPAFPEAEWNGGSAPHLANTLNVSFPGLSSETLLMALDLAGVGVSSGSACMVGSVTPSHVLLAMGASPAQAGSAIRFSLGKQTRAEEMAEAGSIVSQVLTRLGARLRQPDAYAVV